MRRNWRDRQDKGPGGGMRLVRAALALALAAALAAGMQIPAVAADPADLGRECSLTVKMPTEFAEDLAGVTVVADLYQVAKAVPVTGYDTYGYEMTEPYAALDVQMGISQEEWEAKAQEAAKLTLDGSGSIEPAATKAAGETAEGLEAGLYLVVARDQQVTDVAEYTKTVAQEADPESQQPASEKLVSVIRTLRYEYTFEPTLVSIPGKDAETGGMTSDQGEWQYAITPTLKGGREERYGSIRIVKTVSDFIADQPATFVFSVEGRLDGEVVYQNVAAITFTDGGQQETLVEHIPAGSVVTVTEEYSGAGYVLVSERTVTIDGVVEADLAADEILSVQFENRGGTTTQGGHGIQNGFRYDAEGNQWRWEQNGQDMTPGGEE